MAPRSAMRREVAPDEHLMRVQDNVSRALDPLSRQVLADHALTEPATLGTTETRVAHLLERKPQGWLLVSPGADARVWQSREPDARWLYLTASAAVKARLLVF